MVVSQYHARQTVWGSDEQVWYNKSLLGVLKLLLLKYLMGLMHLRQRICSGTYIERPS